jgi:hypothetical protein
MLSMKKTNQRALTKMFFFCHDFYTPSLNIPISDGRFLNLLFDKSSVTRWFKQAISDGNRVNWLSFKYRTVNCDNVHNVGDKFRTFPVTSSSFPKFPEKKKKYSSEKKIQFFYFYLQSHFFCVESFFKSVDNGNECWVDFCWLSFEFVVVFVNDNWDWYG